LYRVIAVPIVEKALQGYNGTIFAYGQTGTGKTYTMAGNYTKPDMKGIIPNTFSHIFSQISRASGETSFVVTVTYLEIYNEEVRDLLSTDPNKKLAIRERPDVGVYVKDLMGFTVDSIESITELLNRGNKNRVTRSTLMNDVSSRSHAIFTITIESKDRSNNKTTVGKLNLVDLAVGCYQSRCCRLFNGSF
jgi:kinesin family protein 3/17